MPWAVYPSETYTPPSGAENAATGQVIQSAVWNTIHTDFATAIQLAGRGGINYAYQMLGFADGVNFNSVADTTIALVCPTTNFLVNNVLVAVASGSLTACSVGLFSGAGATGFTLVPSTHVTVSASTSLASANIQQIGVTGGLVWCSAAQLYFRVLNAEGASVTANVYIQGQPLP
jgi:hypothetical protein